MAESLPLLKPSSILYDRCSKEAMASEEGLRKMFTQSDLLRICECNELAHINSLETLLPVIQELAHAALVMAFRTKIGSCWCLRPREAAAKVQRLGHEDKMVYGCIEESREQGIWIKNIKNKTGIKDIKIMTKIVKRLEDLRLVKTIQTTKAPAQKTYILYHLAPSEEVTGGSFYEQGELDEDLVEEMCNIIIYHVRQMSWIETKKKRIKREHSPILLGDDLEHDTHQPTPASPTSTKKRKASSTLDIEDTSAPPPRKRHAHHDSFSDLSTTTTTTQTPFPAGHLYPTAPSIHSFITSNNIVRSIKAATLTIADVQSIIDVLVADEKLEPVNNGYRTRRGLKATLLDQSVDEEGEAEVRRGNALMEMPCGRCPVIEMCGTGGPIRAETCGYFERWLRGRNGGAAHSGRDVAVEV